MSEHSALLVYMPFREVSTPDLALPCTAGVFRQAGWRCQIADINIRLFRSAAVNDRSWWDPANVERIGAKGRTVLGRHYREKLMQFLREFAALEEWDLFVFAVNPLNADLSLVASSFLKSIMPGVSILFLRTDPFFLVEHALALFGSSGAPDVLCRGEAEICLPLFLAEFATTRDHRTSCRGFVYMDQGRMIDNGTAELPSLLKGIVRPDWEQIDLSLYTQPDVFSVFLTRGCPYSCVFCCETANSGKFRYRKAEDLMSEIREMVHRVSSYTTVPSFQFVDLLINGNMRELERLCDLLIRENLGACWSAAARLRPQMTRAILEKMSRAGCNTLIWGLEHASQRVLDLMKKKVNYETAKRILMDANAVGITNIVNFVVGFPGETPADLVTNIMAIKELEAFAVCRDPLKLAIYPGSRMHVDPQRWGVVQGPHLATEWITTDGRNDSQVRELRWFLQINATVNQSLSLRAAIGSDKILGLDFNKPSLASDIAGILLELWKVAGLEDEMIGFLTDWQGKDIQGKRLSPDELRYWTPAAMPAHASLENWFNRDKNSREQKLKICLKAFTAIRAAYAAAETS